MLSRRQFLQAAGITVAAASLPRLTLAAPRFDAVYGRALSSVSVHAMPSADAPLVTRLWSDTVLPILATSGGWYRLPHGYARREDLQPIVLPVRPAASVTAPPFWGEVTGALAVVRGYCAADAPLVARIGHGGILCVIDYLPDGWYGVAESEDGDLLGWTQSANWSPVQVDDAAATLTVEIYSAAQQMQVFDGTHALLKAPISTGQALTPGVYPITERQITPTRQTEHHGAPWSLRFGDGCDLTGVYWHNRFGAPAPGAAIQMMTPLARWLFPRAARVIVS